MKGIDWMRLEVMYAKNEKKRKICRAYVCATRWKERLSPPRKLLSWQRELNVAHTSLFKRPDRSCIVPLFRSHESPTNINWLLIGAQISVNGTCVLNHSFFFYYHLLNIAFWLWRRNGNRQIEEKSRTVSRYAELKILFCFIVFFFSVTKNAYNSYFMNFIPNME